MEGKLRRRQGSTEQRQYNLLDKRSNWNSFQTISTRNCSNSLYALSILIFFPKKSSWQRNICRRFYNEWNAIHAPLYYKRTHTQNNWNTVIIMNERLTIEQQHPLIFAFSYFRFIIWLYDEGGLFFLLFSTDFRLHAF